MCDLLGLPEETLGVLAQDGVVGDAPAPGLRPPAAVSVEPLEQGVGPRSIPTSSRR
ncbi:MAG: hypothetical protein U0531_18250 [Dehalococcoidia bacterium]